MAQSRSSSVKRTAKGATKKSYTLEQATRALVFVKRVVADIVVAHQKAVQAQQELNAAPAGADRNARQQEFQRAIERLQELTAELTLVGVELKDYATGLIDFPGKHKGREVYLCWRLGEEGIGFFHEVDAGVAGRRPVSELEEK